MTPAQIANILEVLEDTLDYAIIEHMSAVNLYKAYPTRQARIEGLAKAVENHKQAINDMKELQRESQNNI